MAAGTDGVPGDGSSDASSVSDTSPATSFASDGAAGAPGADAAFGDIGSLGESAVAVDDGSPLIGSPGLASEGATVDGEDASEFDAPFLFDELLSEPFDNPTATDPELSSDDALPLPPMPEGPAVQRRLIVSDGEGTEGGATAEEVFDLRIRTVSEQVGDLKEQVSRTKARLQLLADAVLGGSGVTSGAKLILEHHNQLGAAFRLVGVQYSLDGAPAFLHFDDSGDFNKLDRVHVFDQRVVPGEHQLVVRYTIRGSGHGVFNYLENYTLELTATHDFTVEPGVVTSVRSLLREKSDLTLPFEDRPDVAFETHVETDFRREGALPQASAGGAGP